MEKPMSITKTNILPFLACVFAAYEGKEIKPCVYKYKEESMED